MQVINVLGSPGIGKSTFSAGLFECMKGRDMSVEFVDEFAKSKVYEDNMMALSCQPFIFGTQLYKLHCIQDKVDFAITDSPIILSKVYLENYPDSFGQAIVDIYRSFDSINILLKFPNIDNYDDSGRIHSESESRKIQEKLIDTLESNNIKYTAIDRKEQGDSLYYERAVKEIVNKYT